VNDISYLWPFDEGRLFLRHAAAARPGLAYSRLRRFNDSLRTATVERTLVKNTDASGKPAGFKSETVRRVIIHDKAAQTDHSTQTRYFVLPEGQGIFL
jgi:hypothetical protein